jgi:N-acetylglucosamine kinase-like BadF-type ATPase
VKVFLGIDGGGTKTEFLLIDATGRVLATHRSGPAYYLEIGLDALREMLCAGIRATLTRASLGAPFSQPDFAFIGLPAYAEDSALVRRLDEMAADVLSIERYRCGNDMVCGWAGALGGRDGINIVAGTGSIAYGEYEARHARAGGWGELFSDEGSAYWIAREGLTLFSHMSDGQVPRSALYELVRAHFQLSTDLDLCARIYGPPPLERSALASLASLVTQAARAGDTAAGQLFERAALALASIVHAVRDQLNVPGNVLLPVSYSGGLFRPTSPLLPLFEAALRSGTRSYELVAPSLPPVAGAALYAAKLAGAPLDAATVTRLAQALAGSALEESA